MCSTSESSGALTGTNTLRSVFNKVGVNIDLWFVCFNQNSGWPWILKVLNSCSMGLKYFGHITAEMSPV